ncbi:phage tail spike protein [Streptococcus oralis]|uniref:phage tail spike protein n=1 Tax=Streptococcus oralis TaxID=1303 RepID=UPI001CBEA3F3|nr:phage tail spike protein [Streptococcus oralis]
MLYLLNKDVRTVRWNGEPLHEATSAIVKETMNGDFTLNVKYPISDSGIYQLIKEDMLIKAPTPVLGAQLFRIKKPVEHNDHLEITAYHISDDVMQRSITPMSVTSQSCGMALSRMVQNTKTALGDFSFNSDIQDRRTFNTTETETLYSVLLDGKHSIVGTWEGELVRDNFALTVKKSRGENRGVVITTHKNLKDYQRTRNSQNVVTRIHAKSTFRPEGSEKETTLRVTVDSPLINSYPYINEKEYENNNAKSVEELQKWAQAKFSNEGIDKVSDAIKIEAYELDGQVVHIGDTVNLKSWKHNVDAFKKAIAYEFDALKEEYISLTFDDKAGTGGSRASGGLSSAADAILGVTESAQEIALEKALQNADLDFDHKAELLRQEISDGIELARARAEEVKQELSDTINQRFNSFDNGPLQEVKRRAEEALRNAGASTLLAQEAKRIGLDSVAKLEEFKRQATSAQTALLGDLDVLKRTIANDIRPKQAQAEAEISKQVEALVQTKKELAGVKSAQSTFEQSTTRRLSELTNLANGKASKSELTQTAEELTSKIASVQVAHRNQGDRVSAIESNFKQRADALDAGVNRLTEGLRTKADISSLNVTAENIRQSVKSLETNTQNKLNQKLSLAEFEVRAGSIRQEILNATKDKADKTLVISKAGKIREEFSKMKVGGRNYAEDYDFSRSLWQYSQGDSSPQDWTILNGEYNVKGTTNTWKQMQIYSKEGSRASSKSSTALLDLEIGETYTLSFQGICYSGSPNVWVSLRANRTAPGNPEIMNGNFTLTSSWQTYQVTIPALTKPDNFDFWRIILGYSEIGHVAFRKVELTRSSTRIDAGPAPEDGKTDLVVAKSEFQKTADGLSAKLATVENYVGQDGQRQEALRRYTREESAKQVTSVRELVTRDYVGKSAYQEDVRGIERRLEAITNPQNGSIATQIAKYKTAVDGRFADITSMISGKANQTDFQRVRETSQLYERILGNTENGIADKVARMALTSQLFQVEVSKASASGRNLFLNSLFKRDLRDKYSTYKLFDDTSQTKGQLAVSIDSDNQFRGVNTLKIVSTFNGKTDNQKITFSLGGNSRTGRVDELKNKSARFSFWAKSTVNNTNFQARAGYRGAVKSVSLTTDWQFYDVEFIRNENTNATSELILHVFSNATVWIAFPKVEIGTVSTLFSEAPEDTDEAIRSVQTQLAGSWAVQNLTSAGALVSGLNLGANGHNRLDGKLTHITGETLIDKAVIKSAMVDKLKTANFEAGSVTTVVLDAEAVTAEKLKVDQAFFNKLVANEAYLNQLFAKQAFINRVQSVVIDASQVRSGILSGDRIYGGTIRGASIYGGTLTGHTKIQLGSYGSFDTVNGGLQINVPRDYNAKDGLGVQFIGSYGRGENVPYGLFIYKDSDFTTGGYASRSDDFLLTVEGYIKANGIGWFKTGKGSINGSSTATIGYWNSSVSLDFGGSGNDIYYSYNGKAYSLWTCVNAHFSDRRLKENIVDCKHKALDYIQQFQFKEYDWKKQEDRPRQAHTKIGLIAQEVQAVDPTLVYENGDTLNLDNLRLTNIALKAIQELALENKTLTQRLENLENERRTA